VLKALLETDLARMPEEVRQGGRFWDVGVHLIAVLPEGARQGDPAPEGVHRDGHDFLVIHLIDRANVRGAESTVYGERREVLGRGTLRDALDTQYVYDSRVLHGVSPALAADPGRPARRCILIFDFNRLPDSFRPEACHETD
jgi:hypothetical protein